MKKCELLSPVGDFDCLKAAIQNGADSVYLGASSFSARAFANNFNYDELKRAIEYAKLRNVEVHLALNTLIRNDELENAINLAITAYNYGIDAIIVQDLGLAKYLIDNLKNLPIHASTQMTVHNLESINILEKLGFSRAVLSRELSLNEIEYITKNSNIEIEAFMHGALCISYSGQCLLSSAIGGRSGNRGRCAGPCRLPYELLDSKSTLDKGYLLSCRDLCSLEFLPQLINCGITSFKIEGRMKSPEYVATVTRIYRKYMDLVLNNKDYKIDNKDLEDLLQSFNRGNFSTGHLSNSENRKLIYKEKPDNTGIYIGNVTKFNSSKGHIKLKLTNSLAIGDKISVNSNKYNVSELMINNKNVKTANINDFVEIGRMKGNISENDKIYKIESKELTDIALKSFNSENKKIKLSATLTVKENLPIELKITSLGNGFYKDLSVCNVSNIIPEPATNTPITKERLISQLNKTGNTEFEFTNININLDDNLYIPSISSLNELRRDSLSKLENLVLSKYINQVDLVKLNLKHNNLNTHNKKVAVLLNTINLNFDYSNLNKVDKLYIPLKYFILEDYSSILKNLCDNFNVYIYMPTIIRKNYKNIIANKLDKILEKFKICGFVISHISQIEMTKKYNLELIGNYTLNVFNNLSINELNNIGLSTITYSPELDKSFINFLDIPKNSELIVYGKLPVMTMNYCPLGASNKGYADCKKLCKSVEKFYLKDRLNFKFRIIPDNIETVTTMYNSKITSISHLDFICSNIRIDIIDESVEEINNIVKTALSGNRLEGKDYTNGNTLKE